jgi:uncharacterized Zn finger protein
MKKDKECPKCGSTKHQETIIVETDDGKELDMFKCKACGHEEHAFSDLDAKKERAAIEHMGDAFREYLAKKKRK